MSSDDVTQDYAAFDPHAYLLEYYADIGPENQALLRFLVRAFRDLPAESLTLDFGGGPALYASIVASGWVREIHFADYFETNLREVARWLDGGAGAFDWSDFVRATLELEGRDTSPHGIAARQAQVRARVTKLVHCDAKQACPLDEKGPLYDVLMSNFCVEAAASSLAEWWDCTANLTSLLKPGGRLVLSAIKGAESYGIGDRRFLAVRLEEADLTTALMGLGFDPDTIAIETVPADRPDRQYEALMFVTATKLREIG